MNILITGSTGFIGKHLCEELKKMHSVFFLVRPHSSHNRLGANNDFFIFGNNNILELRKYIQDNNIEGIIHLASLYIQRHNIEDIPNLIQSNLYLGTAILEAAVNTSVKWFINTGTIWQNYNSPDGEDKYCPVNLYAATKQAFIDLAKFYTETTNIKFCTLKLCDTYGPNDTRKKILSLFEDYANSGEVLRMSPGYQKIDLLHIDDVVAGFVHLINLLNESVELKPEYVLSSCNQMTLRELAEAYESKYNVKLNIKWGALPYREREVMNPYVGNILPGWFPKYDLRLNPNCRI
jgi:nucleoside-diphosphate-sugar epimerase